MSTSKRSKSPRWLRDRLREADWKWNIVIRVGLKFDWHKLMPRHLAHGRHNAFVQRILADCVAQRKGAGGVTASRCSRKGSRSSARIGNLHRRPIIII